MGRLHPVLLDRKPAAVEVPRLRRPGARARRASKRFAMYTQLHHAAVDGQAAVALAQAILDLSPEPREIDAAARQPRAQGPARHDRDAARGLGNQVQQMRQPGARPCRRRSARCRRWRRAAAGGAACVNGESLLARAGRHGPSLPRASATSGWRRARGSTPRCRDRRAFAGVSLPLAELNAARPAPPREPERCGADDLQRRVAAPLRQARAAAAQVAGGGGADLAARQGRHRVQQPGLDEPVSAWARTSPIRRSAWPT